VEQACRRAAKAQQGGRHSPPNKKILHPPKKRMQTLKPTQPIVTITFWQSIIISIIHSIVKSAQTKPFPFVFEGVLSHRDKKRTLTKTRHPLVCGGAFDRDKGL
jgi:hypothetical protein